MCNNINMIAVATGKFKRSFVVKPAKFKRRFPLLGTQYDGQAKLEALLHPLHQLAGVAAVDPYLAQLLAAARQVFQQQARTIAVLHGGSRDQHRKHHPQGINQDVTLAPVCLFARIEAPYWRGALKFSSFLIKKRLICTECKA
jgi:hypothetical protein